MNQITSMWHQVVVQHNGNIRGKRGKHLILMAIYKMIDNEEFYPVSYAQGCHQDHFLVCNCQPALYKLYNRSIQISIYNGAANDLIIPLNVHLNVAKYEEGQISPMKQIRLALNDLFEKMLGETLGSINILNLSNFADNMAFGDVIINMCNREVMHRICHITRRNRHFQDVNSLDMKCNGLDNLAGLRQFSGKTFQFLDLRGNQLYDIQGLCDDLKFIRAEVLLLDGNPIAEMKDFPKCLKAIASNFPRIDRVCNHFHHIELTMDWKGHRIDKSNKSDIYPFRNSDNWHAFIFPDSEQKYSKEDILESFSNSLPSILSEVYPCYYKYAIISGEHKFVMRKCFEQIQYLVEECNLELCIPCGSSEATSTIDRIGYHLLMDAYSYRDGQLDAIKAISKAIDLRFNHSNRCLNLNKFRLTHGLENIVINMKRTKILSRILTLASNSYLMQCVELDLAFNNIKSMKIIKKLHMLANLKIIDLGYNCISSLEDIRDLSLLDINTLRLDGNPICRRYGLSPNYIRDVKLMLPQLTILDNICIAGVCKVCSEQNFLHSRDDCYFVEDFVPRFYKMFEGSNRMKLLELYEKNAIFTLTYKYETMPLHSKGSKQLDGCMRFARNIMEYDGHSQIASKFYYGRDEIMKIFQKMPDVSFDTLSFTTDATAFDKLFIITVTGVFLYQDPTIQYYVDKLMAFSRTLIIKPLTDAIKLDIRNKSFEITNDQMNLYNPSKLQIYRSLHYPKLQSAQANANSRCIDTNMSSMDA